MTKTDYQKLLAEIRQAGKQRNYKLAIELCSLILAQTDEYPEILLYLGRSYHALKLYDKALYVFRFFQNRKPDSLLGNFFLARTYAALGLFNEAIEPLKKVLKQQPSFSPALSFLGIAYLKLKKPELAIQFFEKAVQIDSQNKRIYNAYLNSLLIHGIRLFYRKEFEQAARVFEFLVSQQKSNIVPVIYLAVIAKEFGNFEYALYYYDEAIKLSPADPVFHLHKAYLLFQLGREKEALNELNFARSFLGSNFFNQKNPEELLRIIALAHFKNKHWREAIYFGKQALKLDYRDPAMHILLAECYRYFGDFKKAKNHYLRAKESDPQSTEIFYGLAGVLWEKGDIQELFVLTSNWKKLKSDDKYVNYFYILCLAEKRTDPESLIPLLQEQIQIHGPEPNLMWYLARSYYEITRPDLALNWLLRVIKIVENHRQAYILLEKVYEKLGDTEKQLALLKTMAEKFNKTKVLKKYIRLLLQIKRYQDCIQPLEKLLTLFPAAEKIKRTLGLVYIKAKNYHEALVIFKELIFKNPKSIFYLRQFIYCIVKIKKLEQAVLILEKATKFLKRNSSLLLPLGVIYGRLKNYEKSASIFREVLSLNAKDWRAYYNLAMLYKRMNNKELAANFMSKAKIYKEQLLNKKNEAQKPINKISKK